MYHAASCQEKNMGSVIYCDVECSDKSKISEYKEKFNGVEAKGFTDCIKMFLDDGYTISYENKQVVSIDKYRPFIYKTCNFIKKIE